jgi:serralysin
MYGSGFGTAFHAGTQSGRGGTGFSTGSTGSTTTSSGTAVTVTKTGNPEIDGLLYGTKWTGTVTYGFPTQSTDYGSYSTGENTAAGFAPISAEQQAAVHYTMSLIAAYTNLDPAFTTSTSADIRVATSSKANPTAYAYTPGANQGGDVWFGNKYNYTNPILGDYYYLTHIHELGHALGLKHSQELGGVANVAVPSGHDALEYTVMSYRSYVGGPTSGYTNEAFGYPTTFMMNDILALQTLYGADYTTNAGDTVYTWNATTGQMSINGVGQLTPGANRVFMTIWDGGGNDTYDMSNYGGGVTINLNPGTSSLTSLVQRAYLGTNSNGVAQYASGTVYNAYLFNNDARSYIENAIGGAGADTIIGNAVANILDGRGGTDVLTGGAGVDTFVYGNAYGADRITDFNAVDKIDLRGLTGIGSLEALLAKGTQSGSNAVFDFGGGNTLTLTNYNLNSLTTGNFLFTPAPIVKTGAVPTNMGLSANSAVEGAPAGTVVGTLSTTDSDIGQTYTYSLVDSAGGLFAINGDKLVVAGALNYETATSYQVTVRVTDSGFQTYDKTFTVNVGNVAPTAISDTNNAANTVVSGAANGTLVGITALANDPNGGVTYSLTDNAGGRFAINATTGIVTVASGVLLDASLAASHTITVRATDGTSAVTTTYTIAVTTPAGITLNGTSAANTLNGTAGNDTISGMAGNDTLYGFAGNDTLNGGTGSDTMYGGLGNDTYVVDATGDKVIENANEGTDTIQSSVTYTLPANVENLTLTGSSAINGTGNDLANVITGNSGNNTLAGLGGADTLNGGGGTDTATYAASPQGVNVSLMTGKGTGGHAEGDTLVSIENVTGSAYNDTIEGSAGANTLNGGAGIDTLSYANAGGAITVSLASTRAQATGGAGSDTISNFENVTGSAFNDRLTGSSSANLLKGGAGLDTLTGGGGADGFVFDFPNLGLDTITDFVSRTDYLLISASGFGGGLVANVAPTLVTAADIAAYTHGSNTGYFFFDNSGTNSGTIYWDANGGSSSDAIAFAKINGTTLVPADFHIV